MSSVIFQPLLHDTFGWKTSKSTYTDTYKWKKYRAAGKDNRVSTYSQQHQRDLQKLQKLQQTDASLPPVTNDEQTTQRVVLMKKNREATPAFHRYSPSKTSSVVSESSPAFIGEYKQRPVSINTEATNGSRASHHSSTVAEDVRRSSKDKKEKIKNDPDNDNSRHWLTYPNLKTPQYLINIRQRLGRSKIPLPLARTTTASNVSAEQPESLISHRQQQQQQPSTDQQHIFDFNLPNTPDDLRASRHRLERHRYNPSLDNYPTTSQTFPVRTTENSKVLTPPATTESQDEQLPPIPTASTTTTKDDVWTDDEDNKISDNETSSILLQMVDVDGLPSDYVEAVETANTAHEEYFKNLKINNENKSDELVYRLPSISSDRKTKSVIAYYNQQQSTPSTDTNSTSRNEFGTWVRNATDKERKSAMKILRDVLHQPKIGYDSPAEQQIVFKQASQPFPKRINSMATKFGRVRTRTPHKRMVCEICEKQRIKNDVWNLKGSDTLACPHQAQGTKPPIIEVRT